MFLTCPDCQTQYKLDAKNLRAGGRTVRCTNCQHIWFQTPEHRDTPPPEPPPPPPEPEVFEIEMVMAPVREEADLLEQLSKQEAPSFGDAMREAESNIPDVIKPIQGGFEVSPTAYRTIRLGATQLGFFSFLLLTFMSVIVLLSIRTPLVQHYPVMGSLYSAIGLTVHAPGEGLRISEMSGKVEVIKSERTMRIEAKLTNLTEGEIDYPALQVTLKGPYGVAVKDWNYEAKGTKIAAGDVVPLKFDYDDVPDDGATVQIRVIE